MTKSTEPKVLLYDIETAPATVMTWSLFKPFIGLEQVIDHPRIIAWSAKWYDSTGKSKKVLFDSEFHSDQITMLTGLRDLMDEADVVVGYNNIGFDNKWVTGEFFLHKLDQPSPYQSIDLWQIGKRNFRFLSGKLDYMAWRVLEERKVSHAGFSLWRDCMGPEGPAKDRAWRTMKKYAKQDTALLEPLFTALRPFIKGLNFGLYTGSDFCCPVCGSENVERRGYALTMSGKYPRFRCNDCGKWSKHSRRVDTTELRPM